MKISGFSPYIYRGDIERFISPPLDMVSNEDVLSLTSMEDNVAELLFDQNPSRKLRTLIDKGKLVNLGNDVMLVLRQDFKMGGKNVTRTGLICSLHLERESDLIPHEATIREYVVKRKNFFAATGAQIEPVFIVSPGDDLERTLSTLTPDMEQVASFADSSGILNTLYLIDSYSKISELRKSLSNVNGIIADGHHRVKALSEINEYRASKGMQRIGLLSYITSIDGPGLMISGIHRIIRKSQEEFLGRIRSDFFIREMKSNVPRGRMILYDGSFKEMEPLPETRDLVRSLGFYPDTPSDYSNLIFSGNLKQGMDFDDVIEYTPYEDRAIENVRKGEASAALLMPSWAKDEFLRVVSKGRILPPKSTFFYPKVYAGITISFHEHEVYSMK